ncbi:MAG: TIGR03621 family F420-dependent LLM class oxidoreductase [Actinomycetota bacterium]|nr:TIGR03621 family F420-dependent LLM class oxidoreductase [Actinomycetota bacterium]
MSHPHPFRFGVQVTSASDGKAWAALAGKAEDLGFSSLFLPDHFGDQLATVPGLMAAADATTTLRVGALVWDNDYKHPVVLAKEAATIDVLSGGRLEFGIGAGWMNTDYEQSGLVKDRDGVRIARLAEAVTIFKGLWAPGPFSFDGDHYRISNLDGLPKPAQQPHPPLLIGGGGPKVLTMAARQADIVGINPAIPKGYIDASSAQELLPAALDRKIQHVRDGAGARFEDLELNILVFATSVGPQAGADRQQMAEVLSVSPEDLDASPYAWVGEPAQVADQLRAARQRWGTSYFVVQGEAAIDGVAAVVAELAGT